MSDKLSMQIATTRKDSELDSSTRLIKQVATKRGIKYSEICFYKDRLDHEIYELTYSGRRHVADITRPDITSSVANSFTINKPLTQIVLEKYGFPNPQSHIFSSESEGHSYFNQVSQACVVKPVKGAGGQGVTVNINTDQELLEAIKYSKQFDEDYIIEKFYEGLDYRCLLINYELVAIARRVPPYVVGDGESSVLDLVEKINDTREDNRKGMRSKIRIDQGMENYLETQGKSLKSILDKDEKISVRANANLNTGGYSIAYPVSQLHPSTKETLERVVEMMGLRVSGVDIMCNDLSKPLGADNGTIIEINARPRFRMHEYPTEGESVQVSERFIDMLFPETKA